jgi:hypothetical protein
MPIAHLWRTRRALVICAAITGLARPLAAQETVDVVTIDRIKAEEAQHSQVMDLMSWLTDVHGPRLTGSPITKKAGEWTIAQFNSWGLANAHFETWGPFGRGWVNERFAMQATAPNPFIVNAVPRAWSASTKGRVKGEAILVKIDSMADAAQYAGRLKGKFVLLGAARDPAAHFEAEGKRLTDDDLAKMAAAQPEAPRAGGPPRPPNFVSFRRPFYSDTVGLRWLEKEGVAAVLLPSRSGDGGTIFTDNGSPRTKDAPQVPMVHVGIESYDRIVRTLAKNVPVALDLEMTNRFFDDDPTSFNVIAEIPGTDPALKDEVVMIGGHFDSWHTGTGATDNAAGSAVMMEAMRILKTLGVQPKRTIRIGLWTGEEQGLFGSRAYVKQHYQDSVQAPFKPEQAKFSAYFNVDNGTGKIRGVYEQGNAAVTPIFDAWMEPFKESGMKTLTISNTGGTDHLSFDAVGLPGFQFIQDPVEYGTRTHHSNMDVYERIQPEDMKFNSTVLAAFAWQAAQRADKLPRKAPRVVQ